MSGAPARRWTIAAALALLPGGCGTPPVNPGFPLALHEARTALREMERDEKPLSRPVVVLGGIHDPGVAAPSLARRLRRLVADDGSVISVSFFFCDDFDRCRDRVIDAVDRAWASEDPHATVEVDVIGISMGGLVGRYAAKPVLDGRRLRVRRLFTIGTPHAGAALASLPTLDRRILDMRPGSAFLGRLNGRTCPEDPEIHPYVRLGDAIVGAQNAAPPGSEPRWLPNEPLSFAHLQASSDPRILADIARRLRDEKPWTEATGPPP